MCTPLPYPDLCDRRATVRAGCVGIAVFAVYPEVLLRFPPAAIRLAVPVDACTLVADAVAQRFADSLVEPGYLGSTEAIRGAQRVQPRNVQGFVSINIADPSQECLI